MTRVQSRKVYESGLEKCCGCAKLGWQANCDGIACLKTYFAILPFARTWYYTFPGNAITEMPIEQIPTRLSQRLDGKTPI